MSGFSQPSLFDDILKKAQENKSKNTEAEIEDKMKERNQNLFNKVKTNMQEVTNDVETKEISLRKNNRDDEYEKRRKFGKAAAKVTTNSLKDKIQVPRELFDQLNEMKIETTENFNEYLQLFRDTSDVNKFYGGLVGLRKISSINDSPPIQEIIDAGLVYEMLKLLDSNYEEFKFEALWMLTNIASSNSDHVNSIVQKDGIQKILNLVDSNISETQAQAIWCIGNIVGDCVKNRDKALNMGALDKIAKVCRLTTNLDLIKQCVWSLSNFCRGKPILNYEYTKPVLELAIKAVFANQNLNEDLEELVDLCWIFSHFTENHKKSIKLLIDMNVLPVLLNNLKIPVLYIQLPSLRILGNICSGNATQTQRVLETGALEYFKETIFHEKNAMRKETCWIISNLAAGTTSQVEQLIECDYLPILQRILETDNLEIRKESVWAICNLTSTENQTYVQKIMDQNIIEIVSKCLEIDDPKIIAVAIEALQNLLNLGSKFSPNADVNPVIVRLEQLGMFDKLEELQYHPVEIVYEKVLKLLETYFSVENRF